MYYRSENIIKRLENAKNVSLDTVNFQKRLRYRTTDSDQNETRRGCRPWGHFYTILQPDLVQFDAKLAIFLGATCYF